MDNEEIAALYLVELSETSIDDLKQPNFIKEWLIEHDLPTTMHYIFLVSKVHWHWWAQHITEIFKQ